MNNLIYRERVQRRIAEINCIPLWIAERMTREHFGLIDYYLEEGKSVNDAAESILIKSVCI